MREAETFLRRPQVCAITGLSTSTIYRLMEKNKFPRPHAVSKRLVIWRESDIAAWQATIVNGGAA